MFSKYILLLCLAMTCIAKPTFLESYDNEIHWAVLVAGSRGLANYRHQSDVFHAY